MMENLNMKHIESINSTEGKHCDVKVYTACARDCGPLADVTGKRKGSYIVDIDGIECAVGGDIWKERTQNNIKRQRLGDKGKNNYEKVSDVVCDLQVESSTSSSFVCTTNTDYVMSEYEFCEDENQMSVPIQKFASYQVCNETLDIKSSKNNVTSQEEKEDSLSNMKGTTDFKEESRTYITYNCKQVRFSHDINIIPDTSFASCTYIGHASADLCSGKDLCRNKNDSDSNFEVSDEVSCSSSWNEVNNIHGNLSTSTDQICLSQHSYCSVVRTRRQIVESMPHNFGKKTEVWINRNHNFNSISLPCADAQAKEAQCSICFIAFTDQKVAHPGCCSHKFCLDCLQQWAENMNTCPLDRLRFNTIFVKECLDGKIIDRIPVKNCELEDDDVDNNVDYCEVCRRRSSGREEILISCYRCGRMYHLTCVSSPVDIDGLESWICPDCGDC